MSLVLLLEECFNRCNIPLQYAGSVDEGAVNVVVMRIKALDVDLLNSDNWLAVFNIVSGNEEGLFTIHTDHKTNEGILMLVKVGLLCSSLL